jgi:hypothetical protein
MDFMFEDEVDEVGSDVEAYCPKCKADTTHVVISKYEDEIRRVQCNPCGDVHSFRKPRGDVEEDIPEPIAAKKRAMMKKVTWDEFFHKHGEKGGKPYEFREHYHENVIVTHPKFGRGFVSEVLSDSKVEVTFKDARRVLVHNRKDMPGLPLAAEGDGRPSNTKMPKAAAAKGKAGKDAGKETVKETAKPAKAAVVPAIAAKAVAAAASAAKAVAAAAAAAAAAAKKKIPAKTSPAAKTTAAARTAKPARAVTEAAPKRAAAKPGKPPPKAVKKSKK